MFTSVQAAVDSLPAAGGAVCILPGRYVESVVIEGRHNMTLHGCGPRSRIVAPDVKDRSRRPCISQDAPTSRSRPLP